MFQACAFRNSFGVEAFPGVGDMLPPYIRFRTSFCLPSCTRQGEMSAKLVLVTANSESKAFIEGEEEP